jgi:hypothetical protein
MNDRRLAEAMLHTWSGSHHDENWITPFVKAIKGVPPEEAAFRPRPRVASIWEITAHAVPYTEALATLLSGGLPNKGKDWPEVDKNPESWLELICRAEKASEIVTKRLQEIKDDELCQPGRRRKRPIWQSVCDIAVHDAYHAGQVMKLRQAYKARYLNEDLGTV